MFKTGTTGCGQGWGMTTLTLNSIVLNCADPVALADFYAKATGWKVTHSDPDFVTVEGGPVPLSFQRVEGYRVPSWPEAGHHVHLDFSAPDVVSVAGDLGAQVPEFQPGDGGWLVLTDPEGHPFCVAAGE